MDDNIASENVIIIYNFESKGSPQLATGTGQGLFCVGPSTERAKAEQSKGTGRKPWGRVMADGPSDSLKGHVQGDYFGPRAIILARGQKMTKPTRYLLYTIQQGRLYLYVHLVRDIFVYSVIVYNRYKA